MKFNKKLTRTVFPAFVFLTVLLNGCTTTSTLTSPTQTYLPPIITPTFTPTPTLTTSTPTPYPKRIAQYIHGVSFGLHWDENIFPQYLDTELTTLKSLNVNTVRLDLSWFMPEKGSNDVLQLPAVWVEGESHGITPSDNDIRFFSKQVYQAGMDSWIALHLDYYDYSDWTGNFTPSDWSTWEANYETYVLHYARLAEENGIDYLTILNEQNTVEMRTEYLLKLIDEVRQVYSGTIIIQTAVTCPNYQNHIPDEVLEAVDAIGLNFYPSPRVGPDASIEEMTQGLLPQFNELADHFSSNNSKSLILSEFGTTRFDGITSERCITDQFGLTDKKIDYHEMSNFYAAFANALRMSKLSKKLSGVMLHEWPMAYEILVDNNYMKFGHFSPRDNQEALSVISEWYGSFPK